MTVAFSARAHSRRNRWRREAAARSCAPACLRAHRPNRTLLVDANGPVKLARVRMKLETPGRQAAAKRNADALALDLHKKRPGVQKLSMLLHLSEHMNYVRFVVFF